MDITLNNTGAPIVVPIGTVNANGQKQGAEPKQVQKNDSFSPSDKIKLQSGDVNEIIDGKKIKQRITFEVRKDEIVTFTRNGLVKGVGRLDNAHDVFSPSVVGLNGSGVIIKKHSKGGKDFYEILVDETFYDYGKISVESASFKGSIKDANTHTLTHSHKSTSPPGNFYKDENGNYIYSGQSTKGDFTQQILLNGKWQSLDAKYKNVLNVAEKNRMVAEWGLTKLKDGSYIFKDEKYGRYTFEEDLNGNLIPKWSGGLYTSTGNKVHPPKVFQNGQWEEVKPTEVASKQTDTTIAETKVDSQPDSSNTTKLVTDHSTRANSDTSADSNASSTKGADRGARARGSRRDATAKVVKNPTLLPSNTEIKSNDNLAKQFTSSTVQEKNSHSEIELNQTPIPPTAMTKKVSGESSLQVEPTQLNLARTIKKDKPPTIDTVAQIPQEKIPQAGEIVVDVAVDKLKDSNLPLVEKNTELKVPSIDISVSQIAMTKKVSGESSLQVEPTQLNLARTKRNNKSPLIDTVVQIPQEKIPQAKKIVIDKVAVIHQEDHSSLGDGHSELGGKLDRTFTSPTTMTRKAPEEGSLTVEPTQPNLARSHSKTTFPPISQIATVEHNKPPTENKVNIKSAATEITHKPTSNNLPEVNAPEIQIPMMPLNVSVVKTPRNEGSVEVNLSAAIKPPEVKRKTLDHSPTLNPTANVISQLAMGEQNTIYKLCTSIRGFVNDRLTKIENPPPDTPINTTEARKYLVGVLKPLAEDLQERLIQGNLTVENIDNYLAQLNGIQEELKKYECGKCVELSGDDKRSGFIKKLLWVRAELSKIEEFKLKPSPDGSHYVSELYPERKMFITRGHKEVNVFIGNEEGKFVKYNNGNWEKASREDKLAILNKKFDSVVDFKRKIFNANENGNRNTFNDFFAERRKLLNDPGGLKRYDDLVDHIMQNCTFVFAKSISTNPNAPPTITEESPCDKATKYLIAARYAEVFHTNPDLIKDVINEQGIRKIVIGDEVLCLFQDGKVKGAGGFCSYENGIIALQKSCLEIVSQENDYSATIHEIVHAIDRKDGNMDGIVNQLASLTYNGRSVSLIFEMGRSEVKEVRKQGIAKKEVSKETKIPAQKMLGTDPGTGLSEYTFVNDLEFIAETLPLFFDNPEKVYKLNPNLYLTYALLLRRDPLNIGIDFSRLTKDKVVYR